MPFWLEVLKLLVPFAVALSAIWAREWYVSRREKQVLMRLLANDISTQLQMLPEILTAFGKIPIRLKEEGFCIFVSQMTDWYFPTAARLSQLDHKNAFVYSNFASRARHVEASSMNIQRLLHDAISSSEALKPIYQSAIERNAIGLQRDFIGYAEACLLVLRAVARQLPNFASEAIAKAEAGLSKGKEHLSGAA